MDNGEPLKVLFIGAVWPEPRSSAGGTRLMQLIAFFQNINFQVHYCSSSSETQWMANLKKEGVGTFSVTLNSDTFNEKIEQLLPEVVVFDRFTMEEQYGWRVDQACPNALKIIETIDLHSLRLAREKQLKKGGEQREILLNSDYAKREIAAILRADLSLIISAAEMELLEKEFNINPSLLHYLPYQAPAVLIQRKSFSERTNFVTIGNFKHSPNWDSVLHLKREIFPRIRKQIPKAKMLVYGSYADQKALSLNNEKEGFHVLGRAESAQEVMGQARVCLAPLRYGAGIKGKLIDAMLCGTPNVTTSIGAEGMHGAFPWSGKVADQTEEFVRASVELYTNSDQWEQSVKNGDEILNNHFNVETASNLLKEKVSRLLLNLKEHRLHNFMGAMLRHHTLQSTKYLSKWIQEKNKC